MSSATFSEEESARLESLAIALLGLDPIIWVWTERFGARPWPGTGDVDVDKLGEALHKIGGPDWVSPDIIYFLAPVAPGETELPS